MMKKSVFGTKKQGDYYLQSLIFSGEIYGDSCIGGTSNNIAKIFVKTVVLAKPLVKQGKM